MNNINTIKTIWFITIVEYAIVITICIDILAS